MTREEIIEQMKVMANHAAMNDAMLYVMTVKDLEVVKEAAEVLKEQEPLKPIPSDRYVRTELVTFDYKCVVCNAGLVRHWVCCPCCGQAVKWE